MDAEQLFAKVLEVVHRWDHLGVEHLQDGTLLVGRVPGRGPNARLHRVLRPARPEELAALQKDFPGLLPRTLAEFLTRANGMMVFSGRLSIYGIRTSYSRDQSAPPQPFDVRIPNREERIPGSPGDAFFVGSYASDGSRIAILGTSGSVIRCARVDATPLDTWPDFPSMLLTEMERYAALCDHEGRMDPSTFGD